MRRKTPIKRRSKKNNKNQEPLRYGIIAVAVTIAVISGFFVQVSANMPSLLGDGSGIPFESTMIFSSDGSILGTIHGEENRVTVASNQISPHLIKAVIASEDSDFYNHRGISIKAIARAAFANLLNGRIAQGGSTITQQLARTMYLSTRKTFSRKISEAYLALELERKYTKDEILEMYLNQVYWGHNTYGAQAASQVFFGKHAKELTLGEAAMMAGVLGAPEIFSPYKHFDLAVKKRDIVLGKMRELGMISPAAMDKAMKEKVTLSMGQINKYKFNAPYFTTYVLNSLIDKYGRDIVYKGGLRVHTTLSSTVQRAAEAAVSQFISKEGAKYHFSQAALTAIDPKTGHILAMVGGYNFDKSEYNRVSQSKRSPGSSFKPFIYTAAMEKGISPGEIIKDSPTVFSVFADAQHPDGKWRPMNFDRKFRGNVTVRYALENSLNIPAIKLLQKVGIEDAIAVARKMGIKSDISPTLSMVLGTSDMNLLEMTSAYGTFATSGMRAEPMSIVKVTDRDGKVIEENKPVELQVLEPKIANIMIDMMKGVIKFGTGRHADIGRPCAAKTGTSDNFRDAWFIGYVPQMVAGVWVGNDDNTPMKGVAEVSVCPRIWKMFMTQALKDVVPMDFPPPEGVVNVKINLDNGLLAGAGCPARRTKWGTFWIGKEPTRYSLPRVAPSSQESGSENTPADSKETEDTNDFREETF